MDELLASLTDSFDFAVCGEYTVEAGRPDTVTLEKLRVLKRHGITRISVNPQTMEDRVLSAIGRRHSAAQVLTAMEQAAAVGFEHINMDLIAGLPEDDPEGFRRSLDTCLQLGADNITIHTLSLKKGSRITLEGLRIPTAEAVGEMLDYADPTLRAAGYGPYYLYRQKYMSGSFENVGWCLSLIHIFSSKFPTGSTICAPWSISLRKSRSRNLWKPWRFTPPFPTVWVCSASSGNWRTCL